MESEYIILFFCFLPALIALSHLIIVMMNWHDRMESNKKHCDNLRKHCFNLRRIQREYLSDLRRINQDSQRELYGACDDKTTISKYGDKNQK